MTDLNYRKKTPKKRDQTRTRTIQEINSKRQKVDTAEIKPIQLVTEREETVRRKVPVAKPVFPSAPALPPPQPPQEENPKLPTRANNNEVKDVTTTNRTNKESPKELRPPLPSRALKINFNKDPLPAKEENPPLPKPQNNKTVDHPQKEENPQEGKKENGKATEKTKEASNTQENQSRNEKKGTSSSSSSKNAKEIEAQLRELSEMNAIIFSKMVATPPVPTPSFLKPHLHQIAKQLIRQMEKLPEIPDPRKKSSAASAILPYQQLKEKNLDSLIAQFQQEKGEWEELIQMINSESEMDTDNDEELLNSLEPSSEFSSPNELLKQMNILLAQVTDSISKMSNFRESGKITCTEISGKLARYNIANQVPTKNPKKLMEQFLQSSNK